MGFYRLPLTSSYMWILMTSNLDSAISEMIGSLSELTDQELILVSRIIERAYIHILVEQGLRVNVNFSSVSQLA